MEYKRLYYKNNNFTRYIIFTFWKLISNYGENIVQFFGFILLISLFQIVLLLPAPFKWMKAILINLKSYSFINYWYLSLKLLFSFNHPSIIPLNIVGLLLFFLRYFISIIIITSFVNLIIRKIKIK